MSPQRAPQWGRCSCGYPASRDPHAHARRIVFDQTYEAAS